MRNKCLKEPWSCNEWNLQRSQKYFQKCSQLISVDDGRDRAHLVDSVFLRCVTTQLNHAGVRKLDHCGYSVCQINVINVGFGIFDSIFKTL